MGDRMEDEQMKSSIEIYDRIALYLTETELLSPAERVRFLELVRKGALSPCVQ